MRVTGDIGGSMGLLIGASVITLFDAIESFVIAMIIWQRMKKRRQCRSLKKETEKELLYICTRTDTDIKYNIAVHKMASTCARQMANAI